MDGSASLGGEAFGHVLEGGLRLCQGVEEDELRHSYVHPNKNAGQHLKKSLLARDQSNSFARLRATCLSPQHKTHRILDAPYETFFS